MATFGCQDIGDSGTPDIDVFRGGIFACAEEGTAISLTAYLQGAEPEQKVKAAMYKCELTGYDLVGVTEECEYVGGWQTFSFAGSPALVEGNYALLVWSELSPCRVALAAGSGQQVADGEVTAYGDWPDPAGLDTPSAGLVSIYCTYEPSSGPFEQIVLTEGVVAADWQRRDPQGAKASGFLLTSGSQV